ncbi:biotin transporter BioY [Corynebacterium anserum]|uniref:Biotin transporter n=1 Tax=Corynebacterium anserum TaxID=2684406 RepID=A0A7G7YNR0_9CORY|nr:biotin transporter BioY [Corynebacterium anserum]MBC2681720.1 biotin transporter BioY [Corynebacterium anserum]QNH96130.1 biotin transporter BioY [Corynebacterium anserum]
MTSFKTVDIAYIATFAALIIVLGAVAVPIGSTGVPIVLQNMGILLAAMLLGCVRGGLTTALFLAVGLVGVPNLAGWHPTISALAGPTVGYLAGYLISAFVVGAIAERAPRDATKTGYRLATFVIAGIIGVIIQYACGTIGLMARLGLDFPAAAGTNLPFIPGDLLKVVLAASIAVAVTKAVPDLLRR